jgi:hypothetical protein
MGPETSTRIYPCLEGDDWLENSGDLIYSGKEVNEKGINPVYFKIPKEVKSKKKESWRLLISTHQLAFYSSQSIHSYFPIPKITHFESNFLESDEQLVGYLNIPSKNRSVLCLNKAVFYRDYDNLGNYSQHLVTLKQFSDSSKSFVNLFLSSDESYFIIYLRDEANEGSIMLHIYKTDEVPTPTEVVVRGISLPNGELRRMSIREIDNQYLSLSVQMNNFTSRLFLINVQNGFRIERSFPLATNIFPVQNYPNHYYILYRAPILNSNHDCMSVYSVKHWEMSHDFLVHSYSLGNTNCTSPDLELFL